MNSARRSRSGVSRGHVRYSFELTRHPRLPHTSRPPGPRRRWCHSGCTRSPRRLPTGARSGRALWVGEQLSWFLVHDHDGQGRIVGAGVDAQHVLQRRHECLSSAVAGSSSTPSGEAYGPLLRTRPIVAWSIGGSPRPGPSGRVSTRAADHTYPSDERRHATRTKSSPVGDPPTGTTGGYGSPRTGRGSRRQVRQLRPRAARSRAGLIVPGRPSSSGKESSSRIRSGRRVGSCAQSRGV